jgi:hypothetical protein
MVENDILQEGCGNLFINKDMILSILQLTEYQWEVYKNFLKITGDEKEAEKQTKIHMIALNQGLTKPDDT